MDLTDLAALAGQTEPLKPEQLTEAVAAIKAGFPKLHTAIRQEGFRAGLSTTKEGYENEGKTGTLDKALAATEAHAATIAERDQQITTLSEGSPDVAAIQAEHSLLVKGLQKKNATLSDQAETLAAEYESTLSTKERQIFKADLGRSLQELDLKPRELLLAIATTEARYKNDAGQWKVYEEDGKTPIMVDDTTTPVKALAASYADSLPKDAFIDKRPHGPGGDFKRGSLESGTMLMHDFMKLTPQAQSDYTSKGGKPVD